jgi:hypothetical protein
LLRFIWNCADQASVSAGQTFVVGTKEAIATNEESLRIAQVG